MKELDHEQVGLAVGLDTALEGFDCEHPDA